VDKVRLKYKILNPTIDIENEEQLLNEANFELTGSYPASEFDDIGEFLIFLKEAKINMHPKHQIVSEVKQGDRNVVCYYAATATTGGYQLIKKVEQE
jgi:hypothetical protein